MAAKSAGTVLTPSLFCPSLIFRLSQFPFSPMSIDGWLRCLCGKESKNTIPTHAELSSIRQEIKSNIGVATALVSGSTSRKTHLFSIPHTFEQ
jgi:hypothetical protein